MTINDKIPASALLVDLRDPEDYSRGHLPGAVNFTVQEIISEAPHDRMICLYCYAGMKSLMATTALKAKGFKQVENLGGVNRYTGELVREND